MKIVTGYTGTPHITSNDDQARNQGVFGTGDCVLETGNKLDAVLTDATTVTLKDGDGVIQGVHFRIDPGTTEAVSIGAGTTGYNRIDLICARYTKNAGTGVEDVSLVVVAGTPSASTPSAPSVNSGSILSGDTPVDMPLWKVTLTGLTPAISRVAQPLEIEKKVLLWKTGDPTTTPAPDSVQINADLSEFSKVEITYKVTTDAGDIYKVCRHAVGANGVASVPMVTTNGQQIYLYTYISAVGVTSSAITIEKGSCVRVGASQSATTGDYFAPVKVYGIK